MKIKLFALIQKVLKRKWSYLIYATDKMYGPRLLLSCSHALGELRGMQANVQLHFLN